MFITLQTGMKVMQLWLKGTKELLGRDSHQLWWSCLDTSRGNYSTYIKRHQTHPLKTRWSAALREVMLLKNKAASFARPVRE